MTIFVPFEIFFVPLHLEHFLLMFPRQEEEEQQQQQQQQKLLLGPLSRDRGQKLQRNKFHHISFIKMFAVKDQTMIVLL